MSTALKKARENLGFTKIKVAELANISVMSYFRYESGDRIPKADTAIAIAKALDSTVEDLFGISQRELREITKEPKGN